MQSVIMQCWLLQMKTFKKFDEMRTEMYKGVSSAPAGEDLTLHLGLDITGSETDKIDFGTPVMEIVKDLKQKRRLVRKLMDNFRNPPAGI